MRKLHLIITTYCLQITCQDMYLKITLGIHFDKQS